MPKLIDLSGKQFSELKVIARAKDGTCNKTKWLCSCECGNQIPIFSQGLLKGTAKNCGNIKFHNSNRGGAQYKYHGLANTKKYKMYMAAKMRAKMKQVPFSLKLSEMPDIPEKCPILGIPLISNGRHANRDSSPSLDKINPQLGYVAGNVQIISQKANCMKHNATAEEIGKLYFYMKSIIEKEAVS